MKTAVVLFCVLFIAGCSSNSQLDKSITQPELLEQTPLPEITGSVYRQNFRLNMQLLIDEVGDVKDARFIDGSGIESWDSLALTCVKQWRFSPGKVDNVPTKLWVNQTAIVKITDPVYLPLAQILCQSSEDANKIMELLNQGKDFNDLVLQYSTVPSKDSRGSFGKIDINLYSPYIRDRLLKLRTDEFTEPIKFGTRYIIFKRIKI
jgi:hypothetical protein